MLLLKLLRQLIKTLNSQGTPGQVAAGMALGACLGLTPLVNAHNLLVFMVAVITNVALGGFFLGLAIMAPLGFILDPLFDAIGSWLLGLPALQGLWTALYNTPGVPLTNFNNSVVLGSFVFWLVAGLPLFLLFRYLIAKYRTHVYERLRKTHTFQVIAGSRVADVYRWFTPGPG
jgi:uncharacterized protein (TIGR03546 family)